MPRITLTLSDGLMERIRYLAAHYGTPPATLAATLTEQAATLHEDAIACEACAQQAWLAQVEPAGRA